MKLNIILIGFLKRNVVIARPPPPVRPQRTARNVADYAENEQSDDQENRDNDDDNSDFDPEFISEDEEGDVFDDHLHATNHEELQRSFVLLSVHED